MILWLTNLFRGWNHQPVVAFQANALAVWAVQPLLALPWVPTVGSCSPLTTASHGFPLDGGCPWPSVPTVGRERCVVNACPKWVSLCQAIGVPWLNTSPIWTSWNREKRANMKSWSNQGLDIAQRMISISNHPQFYNSSHTVFAFGDLPQQISACFIGTAGSMSSRYVLKRPAWDDPALQRWS